MKTTVVTNRKKPQARRSKVLRDWLDLVSSLVDQVAEWAEAENWSIHRDFKTIHETGLGTYRAPTLRVRTNQGDEVHVNPIARYVMGRADGRVDLQGWPSLNRLIFVRRNGRWQILTDAGPTLRRQWNRKTFAQLARELNEIP